MIKDKKEMQRLALGRTPLWSRANLPLFLALFAILVLVTVPFSHQHQESDSGSQCAACVVQHSTYTAAGSTSIVTVALEVVSPVFNIPQYQATHSREFWIDTLSRGPPLS